MATTLAPNIGLEVGKILQGRHFLTSSRQRCVYMALPLHTTGAESGKLEEVIDRFQMQPLLAPTTNRFASE
jgi:hypothetical protein